MTRRAKTIIAVVVVLLLVALGVFLYFLWNKQPLPSDLSGTFPPPSDEVIPKTEPPTVLPEEPPGAFEPILRQLSRVPIAGAALGARSGEAIARYQERATGNVYEIEADGDGEKRLTNTTIPKVYEALWNRTGTALVARYLREGSGEIIESFSARVVPGAEGAAGELQGTFLPRDIASMAVSPDGASLFYLQEDNGGASGIQSDFSGGGKVKLWASPVREWLAMWPRADKILLLSKPSGLASGMLMTLDPASGRTTLILRNLPGLTALMNPSHSEVLYSTSGETDISLFLFDTATGRRNAVRTTTFPEKCVWNKNGDRLYCGVPKDIPQGTYPDVWYQGVISFEDEVWSVTPGSGMTDRILDISGKRGVPIDLTNPLVSPDEKFLIFTDKESGTLWSLQMKE